MFPRFSPDGKWIAFTGQYDGNTEVYVMPAEGGVPQRLTYTATLERDDVSDRMGPNNIVMTWRDNETVVYRSRRTQWNAFKGELTLARLDGGARDAARCRAAVGVVSRPTANGWPTTASSASSAPGSATAAVRRTRSGSTTSRSGQPSALTDDPAQDLFPMWHGDRIYFVSERDEHRQANLFVLDLDDQQTRQLTQFTEFAVKFPSLGDRRSCSRTAATSTASIWSANRLPKVPIEIREDLAVGRGALAATSARTLTSFDLAPDGARGRAGRPRRRFTVPAKHGPTRNLTQTPGVHERDAGLVARRPVDRLRQRRSPAKTRSGSAPRTDGAPAQLTRRRHLQVRPRSGRPTRSASLWSDKKNRLQFVDVDSKQATWSPNRRPGRSATSRGRPTANGSPSPEPEVRRFPNIYLYSLAIAADRSRSPTAGSTSAAPSSAPTASTFSSFPSVRSTPPTAPGEWNHVYTDMARTLPRHPGQGHPVALRAQERRGEDRGRRGQRRNGPKEDAAKAEPRPQEEKPTRRSPPQPRPTSPAREESRREERREEGRREGRPRRPRPTHRRGARPRLELQRPRQRRRQALLPPQGQAASLRLRQGEGDRGGRVRQAIAMSADQKKMLVEAGGDFAIVDLPSGKLDWPRTRL